MSEITIPTARFTAGRAYVDVSLLLEQEESESGLIFKAFLSALDRAAKVRWDGCGNSLAGALQGDNEEAHMYVALHLPEYKNYISTDPEVAAFSFPPHRMLLNAYQMGYQQSDKAMGLSGYPLRFNCSSSQLSKRFMALTSAVDMLRGVGSKDYVETVLGDYRKPGTQRKKIADSLCGFIRAIERHSVAIADHPGCRHAKGVK